MYINVELLSRHGYDVIEHKDERDNLEGIRIEPTDGNNILAADICERMKIAFPEVAHDTIYGLAHECAMAAQGQDIVRICSKG